MAEDFRYIITSGTVARYANTTEQAAFLAGVTIKLLDAPVITVLGDGYNAGIYLTCWFIFLCISCASVSRCSSTYFSDTIDALLLSFV